MNSIIFLAFVVAGIVSDAQSSTASTASTASISASTTAYSHLCYPFWPFNGPIDQTAALVRKQEAEDIVEELGNENMNALDKLMLTTGVTDPNFCPLVEYVLNQQQNRSNMSIMIDGFYSCNQCDFWYTWNKLAALYSYRKRFKANFVVLNYTDINCQRRISYYSIGQHTGLINYLPTTPNPPNNFTGPLWHTSTMFLDVDRFEIEYLETKPNVFQIVSMIQYTEGTFPLGNYSSPAAGLITGRSPLNAGAPGNLPLALPTCTNFAASCPAPGPPRATPCPGY